MTYTAKMQNAADRHYNDAVVLEAQNRHDNAGYHYGLSTECVVKGVLEQDCGLRPSDDAWWAHFPGLRNIALLYVANRNCGRLRTFLENPSLMQEWDIPMRYSATGTIDRKKIERWKNQANDALGLFL